MKELKSLVDTLTKYLEMKQDETFSEQSCTSSSKKNSPRKKRQKNSSTKDAKQFCQELKKQGHFADGVYQVPHPTETKKIETISCEFTAANDSN